MMKEQLITFETAKLAKEKGFMVVHKLPTQSLLQKWLREKHNLNIKVDDFLNSDLDVVWDFEIVRIGTDLDERGNYIALVPYSMDANTDRDFKTYEEALEKGLQEALKLI
jgi:hypothetical protein